MARLHLDFVLELSQPQAFPWSGDSVSVLRWVLGVLNLCLPWAGSLRASFPQYAGIL